MRKLMGLVLGILVAGCAPGSQTREPQAAGKAPGEGFRVVYLEGTVTADGQSVTIGQVLGERQVLKTGAGSLCEVTLGDKNGIRLGELTTVDLGTFAFPRTLDLQAGTLALVLRKLEKLNGADSFKVKTPQTALGVRGTSFFVKVEGAETYHCSCNGEVHLTPYGGEAFSLKAQHHAARKIGIDGVPVVSTLLFHDDKTLETLAQRIGETLDWSRQE